MMAVGLLVSGLAFAQQSTQPEEKPQVLFNSPIRRSSAYGATVTKFSTFNNEFAVLAGAYGGWFVNDRFMIGLGGYGMARSITAPDTENRYPGKSSKWNLGYGGLALEYTLHSKNLIHASFNTLVGAGGIGKQVEGINYNNQDWRDNMYDGSAFFVVEPGANVELNVTSWFRVGAGASYRYVKGSYSQGISDSQLSAPSANVSLKFGRF